MKGVITIILLGTMCHLARPQKSMLHGETFSLGNDKINLGIEIIDGRLDSEQLTLNASGESLISAGDFGLEIAWTDWMAPGMHNNAENPTTLSKKDFKITNQKRTETHDGGQQLELDLKGTSNHLQLRLTYLIEPDKFYVKRKIAVRDTVYNKHFLHKINAYTAALAPSQPVLILKEGGFGQPIALQMDSHGLFAGLEYPASTNTIRPNNASGFDMQCSQLKGIKISDQWVESNWVVIGLTPDPAVKKWFMLYINDIKVAANRPYTLYNSWYDLRGEKYPVGSYVKELSEVDYMTDKNVMRLYNLFQANFTKKYGVELNAFVLDDGWDVYESDWALNKNEFPNGLTPIRNQFEEHSTSLGLWFGPSGGYSARMKRVNWYRENGYEVVGQEKQWGGAQLCLAGKNYSQLFKQRVAQFTDQGVFYYKWDGFQFSCSEADHGHPIGLYAHVAVLDTLLSTIEEVHQINPDVFHSVTSGTWLSPWWLKHANQIWMQGEDYGLADVPSYDLKDAAITYRDLVLYDGLQKKKHWFPVSNMMTHGVIKGKLEELYLDTPIDKFTDNALLYFARGVSMYELYTSPDVMEDREWKVIADALKWAKHHFETLMNTEMVGGDPGQKEAYGYLHLKGNKGIAAARNPFIERQSLEIDLSTAFGLDKNASNLVLEKVYPYRWISPDLYKAGDKISLPLAGYETAIYELYPLEESTEPLVAGVPFQSKMDDQGVFTLKYFKSEEAPKILNQNKVRSINHRNQKISFEELPKTGQPSNPLVLDFKAFSEKDKVSINMDVAKDVTLACLFTTDKTSQIKLPEAIFKMEGTSLPTKFNGKRVDEKFKMPQASSGWYATSIPSGKQKIKLDMFDSEWKGNIEVWVIADRNYPTADLKIRMKAKSKPRVLTPRILDPGTISEKYKLGNIRIK